MEHNRMLDYGQSQSGSSLTAGTPLVHPVEPFKQSLKTCFIYTLTIVLKYYPAVIRSVFRKRYENVKMLRKSFYELKENKEQLKNKFSDMRKELMDDIQAKQVNINTAYLYLNILQESESMVITLSRLIRSSRKFQLG